MARDIDFRPSRDHKRRLYHYPSRTEDSGRSTDNYICKISTRRMRENPKRRKESANTDRCIENKKYRAFRSPVQQINRESSYLVASRWPR